MGKYLKIKLIIVCLIALLAVAGCTEFGDSSAYLAPIPDGNIILVKDGNTYGAFILKNQRMDPETTDFTWYLRSDGKGSLDPADKAVSSGSVSKTKQLIEFGSFQVEWSVSTNGSGYIYYPNVSGGIGVSGLRNRPWLLCVTPETDITKIDATDPKWVFKGSSNERGQMIGVGVIEITIIFIILAIVLGEVIAFWKIFTKAGWNGAWGILAVVPMLTVGLLLYLAFSKWPIENKLKELEKA